VVGGGTIEVEFLDEAEKRCENVLVGLSCQRCYLARRVLCGLVGRLWAIAASRCWATRRVTYHDARRLESTIVGSRRRLTHARSGRGHLVCGSRWWFRRVLDLALDGYSIDICHNIQGGHHRYGWLFGKCSFSLLALIV